MNTYVIMARHLGKISGEKIYTNNKLKYMVSIGWKVFFISCKKEETPVDNAPFFSQCVFPALTYAPECYSKRVINKTIEKIVMAIGNVTEGEQCIIESDSLNRAIWAELVASRIGAKHLAFFLQETHHYDERARKFLKFKYDRHELAGITDQSINLILADDNIVRRDDTKIKAFCNNVVEDCEDTISPQIPTDATITFGSIGRLDKSCVPAILEGFQSIAKTHSDKKYNIVMIGGATGKKKIRQIQNQLANTENVHLTITGYLYPIPSSLIKRIDLFVSTAGSISASYRYYRPTIRVHPVTGEPVGIIGLDDLEGKTMYDTMPDITLAQCIEKAWNNKDIIKYIYNHYDDYYQKMYDEFDRQLAFAKISKVKEYYDNKQLKKIKTAFIKKHHWHWISGHLFGADGLNILVGIYKKLKKF